MTGTEDVLEAEEQGPPSPTHLFLDEGDETLKWMWIFSGLHSRFEPGLPSDTYTGLRCWRPSARGLWVDCILTRQAAAASCGQGLLTSPNPAYHSHSSPEETCFLVSPPLIHRLSQQDFTQTLPCIWRLRHPFGHTRTYVSLDFLPESWPFLGRAT